MQIGDALPLDPGWRTVEADLYDISRRVREYDADARLVRDDQSGALGLARIVRTPGHPDPVLVFTVFCLDYRNGGRLYGEPDGRVLRHQRIADGHRIDNLTVWTRRRRDAMRADRAADKAERRAWSDEQAKEYVWRRNRVDLGRRPFASFSKAA